MKYFAQSMRRIMLCAFCVGAFATSSFAGFLYVERDYYVGGNQIYGFEVNETTGALTPLSGFPISTGGVGGESTQSEFLTIDHVNGRLYVLNDVDPSVSAYSINRTTGALTPLPFHDFLLPIRDWATIAVHPSGSPLTIGDQGQGTPTRVASYNITATTATAAPGSPFSTGGGARLFSSVFSRDGNYLYGGGNIESLVAGLSVNADATLSPLPGSPFNGGSGYPAAYATDSMGRLYLTNYSLSQSYVFTTTNGVPTPVNGNPFSDGGLTTVSDGVLHPNENFYVVANRNPSSVGVMQISGSGANTTLTPVAGSTVATGGIVANALVFNQAGTFLFVANATSRNITTFSFNPATGALANVGVQPANTLGSSGRINGIGYIGGVSQPPVVQLTAPANNSTFVIGQSVLVAANATDPDGTIQRVEFYDGSTLIGTDTSAPYIVGWNYPFGESHVLTARAFDDSGASTTSAPVNVTFVPPQSGPLPLPFGAPTVTSPANGTAYDAPATITLSATLGGGNYLAARVKFYLNTTLVGIDTQFPYSITVSNIPAGRYSVFAKTVATSGAEEISQPVDIIVNGTTPPHRTQFDFDGDGKADISVFRPSNNVWYLNQSTSGFTGVAFGLSTDKLAPADYDGDGKTDIAVFRDGNWFILQSGDNQFRAVQFGQADDVAQPGDYDADGKADFAVFRPANGTWYVLESTAGFFATQFGQTGDKPVAADYDGDGKFDVAVYRGGIWYVSQSRDGFRADQFGFASDKAVPADYDGDGKADIAVFRPSNGTWYLQRSTAGFTGIQFGLEADIPAPADYDGDGKTDVAVFRDGTWYLQRSTAGFIGVQFGISNDRPVPSAFVQ